MSYWLHRVFVAMHTPLAAGRWGTAPGRSAQAFAVASLVAEHAWTLGHSGSVAVVQDQLPCGIWDRSSQTRGRTRALHWQADSNHWTTRKLLTLNSKSLLSIPACPVLFEELGLNMWPTRGGLGAGVCVTGTVSAISCSGQCLEGKPG